MRLLTLGGLSVEGGEPIRKGAASQRKALALLALLGGAGRRGLSRDKLVAYLWPDSTTDHALHSLTQLLYSLRRDLAAESLFLGTTDLSLNPELLAVDVAEFTSALEAGDFTRAVGAYKGPFLDGFFLSGVPEFERWVEGRAGPSGPALPRRAGVARGGGEPARGCGVRGRLVAAGGAGGPAQRAHRHRLHDGDGRSGRSGGGAEILSGL